MTDVEKIIEGVRAGTVDEAYAAPFLLDEIDRLRAATRQEEQEQSRLAELREMRDCDIGAVSLLAYETQGKRKIAFALRLRAALDALRRIEADPGNAKAIATAALASDVASI